MTTSESLHPEDWKNIARKDWHRISVLLNDGDAEGAAIFVQQSLEDIRRSFHLTLQFKILKEIKLKLFR